MRRASGRRALRLRPLVAPSVVVGLLAGCAAPRVTLLDTFPPGESARPWVLAQPPWSGAMDQAAAALGQDAGRWSAWQPRHVWLAVYQDELRPQARLTARVFSFADVPSARQAYAALRPVEGCDRFDAGDDGCWTADGVIFQWGRLVYEVFVSGTDQKLVPEQAITLVGLMEKRTPADLPGAPR